MPAPVNPFKKALREDTGLLTGLWVALANPHSAEICAGAGFDWILIDAEHGPNDIPLIAAQLAAVTRHAAHPVVLFSHGLGGSRHGSGYLGEHWSRRGYVAVFLQHPGSDESVWRDVPTRRLAAMRDAASAENFLLRVQDVPTVLDALV